MCTTSLHDRRVICDIGSGRGKNMSRLARRAQRGRGNSKPSPRVRNRSRAYCFTWNNYPDSALTTLATLLGTTGHKAEYVVGKEVGSEGTPHLQGYIRFPHQIAWKTVTAMLPLCHIVRARGSLHENLKYCQKDGEFVSTFPPSKRERALAKYPPTTGTWRPWQERVIAYLEGARHPREIMWLWEPVGNVGKSWLAKYLYLRYHAILGGGQRKDVFHQVVGWQERHEGKDPSLILIDIPRERMQYFQYSTLECLKNGLGASGKYESCCFYFVDTPHVVVFSNEPPDETRLSPDRWSNIICIS